ncbi:MAG: hypothetical protein JNL90_02595 [Planctomycetes bacterium]|nr:hypothetical protein [Planctomycetota bacterium]
MQRSTRALLHHCLRLDVVESAGLGSATLLSGILFSTLVGAAVAGIASAEEGAGAAGLAFALLGLFALVDAVGDVASAWLDPRDLPLLRTFPIAPLAYARARLAALALPVAAKAFALILPSATALVAQGRWREASAYVACFLPFALMVAATALLGLLLLRRVLPRAQLRETFAWVRALLLVAATGGWLALPASSAGALAEGSRFPLLPSAWFGDAARFLAGRAEALGFAWLAPLALSAVGGALAIAVRGYLPLLEELAATPATRRRVAAPKLRTLFERFAVAPAERPGFRLALRLLRRERGFRLQALPLLAYPLLFLWLGGGQEDGGLFALLFAQLPALVLALSCLLLRYSDSPAGGFLLRYLGVERSRSFEGGARKALWWGVALPLALVVTALLIHDRGATFGAAVGALGLFGSTLALVGSRGATPSLPFVEPFRGRVEASEGGRAVPLLAALLAGSLLVWRLLQLGPLAHAVLLAGALAAAALLLRRPVAEAAEPLPPDLRTLGDDAAPDERRSKLPFPRRLRRELAGLAAYFVAAGALLTLLHGWM